MKASAPTDQLQKKLSFINHGVSARADLPVLLNILIEAKDGKITLSSTNLEIGIQTSIPATVEEEGGITVPAKTFTELISSLPQETISLTTEDATLRVKSKKTQSSFQTIAKEEFPKLYEEKGELLAKLPIKTLQEDFSSVIFSASIDTGRPALSGILMRREEQGFLLVATDGYRLSLKHATLTHIPGEEVSLLVPARIFRDVLSLKEGKEAVEVYVSPEKNQVLFQQGETVLIGRLIGAEFPNYERIIPSEHSAVTAFDREELLKAVKICSIFARDAANIITLSLKKDAIIVSSQTPSLGENTVTVEASLTGEENEIAFNARYLLDVLSNVDRETLTFEMTGPLNPGVFRIKDDTSFLHLIMPIRIQA